jgi:two-component system sensor histidine kinase and response regulator WspE
MGDLSGFSMLELFRLEADTQTAALSAAVLAIENEERSPTTIESMMRAAHSLKGAARIVGLEPAVRVAHAMEDVFVAAGQGRFTVRARHADVLLAGIDFLASIGRDADASVAGGPWDARADALVDRLAGLFAESPPAADSTAAAGGPPAEPSSAVVGAAAAADSESPATGPAAPDHAPTAGPDFTATTPPPAHPSAASPTLDRVVRVSADSLTRLVGLAGESLVEARQLRPAVAGLLALRGSQVDLCAALAALDERCRAGEAATSAVMASLLGVARERADAILGDLRRRIDDVEAFARRNEDLSHRLHHEVLASRMRPLADVIGGFPRLVRDVARDLGKQVRLEVRGEQTGVDRDILDKLEAPLSHLIRNALDHGIEMPAARAALDKPSSGTILLDARHRAGMLNITVSDDGGGVDVAGVRARAVARGLVTGRVAERLSEQEVLEFLFLPGFSMKDRVTEISGRGVGLDVVRSMVKAVGGSVRVASTPGRQTVFTLQLPITMSVVRALLVEIGGESYAFPLTRIDQIVSLDGGDIRTVEGRQYFDRDGVAVGLVLASQVLELPATRALSAPLSVVVVSDRGQQFGMIVDAFLGERDLEVRPLDPRLGRIPDISSASLLENGDPVLIVDVEDLVRSIDNILVGRRLSRIEVDRLAAESRRRRRILVVDDSITVRELERQLLQERGFAVDVAVDGTDGWNAVRAAQYDLVVTDVDMPRLDGIGLVSLIKADPARRDIPIVIVSYKDREEDRSRGLDAGASRYLTKSSFHDETFVNTIIELIGEPDA